MMRKELKHDLIAKAGSKQYTAQYSSCGFRHTNGEMTPTICLANIQDEDENIIADHMWFNYTSDFRKLGELRHGEELKFVARAKKYHKGHGFSKQDYKLTNPKGLEILGDHTYIPLPSTKRLMIGYVLIKNNVRLNTPGEDYIGMYNKWARDEYEKMLGELAKN